MVCYLFLFNVVESYAISYDYILACASALFNSTNCDFMAVEPQNISKHCQNWGANGLAKLEESLGAFVPF